VTRLLAILALASALGLSALAMRQAGSGVLREENEDPGSAGGGRGYRIGRYVRGRGYVPDGNRTSWGRFRGGGLGYGK
jgi:hypothetical protein